MPRLRRDLIQGFTLVEIAIVLAIIGLAAGMLLTVTSSMRDAQSRQSVQSKLAVIDTALANFVALNKRLPCPADGTKASGAVGVGVETLSAGAPDPTPKGTCTLGNQNQAYGVVPWVTLGLTEDDATDPWNGRLTYRVDPALAQGAPLTLLMNMSDCDPSSTGATGTGGICKAPAIPCANNAGCTSPSSFLATKGLDVWDGVNGTTGWGIRQNNRVAGTGAAYLLISHGPSGAGALNKNGGTAVQPGSIAAGSNNEAKNVANLAIALPSALGTTYRDARLDDNANANAAHFDDYLSHPTIISVLNKANLGPRAH